MGWFALALKKRRRLKLGLAAAAVFLLAFGIEYERAELVAPPPTALLLDRHGQFLAQIPAADDAGYGYWSVEDLPPRVVAATLAIEDRRFWSHAGVDPLAVGRALWQNLSSGQRISGASTLAMQVARMQNPGQRTYLRKMDEAVTALFLTLRYGREAVLRQYLRLVPYGNGVHGIAYAARFYLDKPLADLSWAEIAFLVAIPQAPSRMNPLSPDQRLGAIARGHRILEALRDQGALTGEEFALAQTQIDRLPIMARTERPADAMHAILDLQGMLAQDASWWRGRPDGRVETTLDLAIQSRVAEIARKRFSGWQSSGAQQLSIVVTATKSREVLAWLGSLDYFNSDNGAVDFANTERSPGSTLKPFIYALALDRGILQPDSHVADSAAAAFTFENADHGFLGAMLPRQALANSRNIPAIGLVRSIGVDPTYLFLRLLGLHSQPHSGGFYGLSLAIGGLPTTLGKLMRAYEALANDGELADLVWYRGQPSAPPRQLISPGTARLLTLFLSDPMARLPSFPRMSAVEYRFPVAVKTGTSEGYRDAWTVAYSPDFMVGVWVGRADAGTMKELGSSRSAAELARDILVDLQKQNGESAPSMFPTPGGYRSAEVCAAPDADALGACSARLDEWLPDGGQGVAHNAVHVRPMIPPFDETPPITLAIATPQDNLHLIRDPEMPAGLADLPLSAAVSGPAKQLVWYVDGRPYRLSAPGDTLRWPLQAGLHRFQVKLPYRDIESQIVTIRVD